jgi:hypothetical protein
LVFLVLLSGTRCLLVLLRIHALLLLERSAFNVHARRPDRHARPHGHAGGCSIRGSARRRPEGGAGLL